MKKVESVYKINVKVERLPNVEFIIRKKTYVVNVYRINLISLTWFY